MSRRACPALLLLAGCAHVNDPYRDSSACLQDDMTTPSTQGYQVDTHAARPICRMWGRSRVYAENGAVTHWPAWFEDPFEDRGNTDVVMRSPELERDLPDNQFAWNWVDYFDIAYGPARHFVNTVGWPISAVVTPPGTLMESDGRIDKGLAWYDHDAKRADSVLREPPDVNIIDKTSPVLESPSSEPAG